MKERNSFTKQTQKNTKLQKNLHNLGKRSKSVVNIQKYAQQYIQTSVTKENINNSQQFAKQTFQRSQQKAQLHKKIQILIAQIKERQAKLNSFFQIYSILQSQCGQQRCIQHNNNLSLYCQNQNKILCVHCMYGANKHKTHKVFPLKDCHKTVCQDNKKLKQKISMSLRDLKSKENICEQNSKFLQSQFKFQLQQIQKQHKSKIKILQKQQQKKLNFLKEYFLPLISVNNDLAAKIKNFQKLVNNQIQQVIVQQEKKTNIEQKQISKHMILQKISQLTYNQGLCVSKINSKDISHQLIRSRIKSPIKY